MIYLLYMKLISMRKTKDFIIKYITEIMFLCMLILVAINLLNNLLPNGIFMSESSEASPESEQTMSDNSCNVKGITLHGDIYTYDSPETYDEKDKMVTDQTSADTVIANLDRANSNPNIKAIIVEIDSSGGSPVAGEEIMRAFKESKKPVIAFVRNMALSTAYLGATGADIIFASPFSDVGSIGITMSYLQNTEKNRKDGLEYIMLSSGKYKDAGSPDRALTQDEKSLFMRDIDISHKYFVKLVSENRGLSIDKVNKLADGSSVLGEMALKEGLIDKIGTFQDVKKYVSGEIDEDVSICW